MNTDQIYQALEKAIEIRVVEMNIADQFKRQKIFSFLHLYIGEEASATGVSMALKEEDLVWGNHRSHGHYLARGGDDNKLVYEVFGDERGCCGGYGGSMHMLDRSVNFIGSGPILGSVGPIVCGFAAAKKLDNQPGIAVGYLGDGAAEEGAFYESINLGGLFKVPLLYVIEDNKYSVESTHSSRKVEGYNFENTFKHGLKAEYIRVNGQDVEEVYNATLVLREKIINEKKVGILHCDVLRNFRHSGANPDGENPYYRQEDNPDYLKKNDCITIMINKLITLGEDQSYVENYVKELENSNQLRFEDIMKTIEVRK